jgi:hypothetical protein
MSEGEAKGKAEELKGRAKGTAAEAEGKAKEVGSRPHDTHHNACTCCDASGGTATVGFGGVRFRTTSRTPGHK